MANPSIANITAADLEGEYEITSETSDGGPYKINSDGRTEIKQGRTYRKDKNGYVWESIFTIIGPGRVELLSTLDPSFSDEDNFIKDNKNNLTREPVTYKGELLAQNERGRLVLTGEIRHGIVSTRIRMTRMQLL
jgi:hypothetical protein